MPIFTITPPKLLASCFAFPASVFASSAFMLPTFCVMISASMAARSPSLPAFSAFSWVSLKVMPTRLRAPV